MRLRSFARLFSTLVIVLGAVLNWWGRLVDLFNFSEDTKAMLASVQEIEADWGLLIFLLGLIGLALTFFGSLWRRQPQEAEELAHSATTAIKESGPNWAILELVQRLLDDGYDVIPCMREIEDRARLGQLAVWGRKYSTVEAGENPNPLKPVSENHWDHYSLDATRCALAEDASTCCTEPRSLHSVKHNWTGTFQDLRVNRSQAMALWSLNETADVSRKVSKP